MFKATFVFAPSSRRFRRFAHTMKTVKQSLSHLERTVTEPRDNALHRVTLVNIDRVNKNIRLLKLRPNSTQSLFTFLPGQWLDVYVPDIAKAGGFTITSSPSLLQPSSNPPYLELAIQESPLNPPAAWLWRPEEEILGSELQIRVGGSFTWPPSLGVENVTKVVFVAGGVGINPLVSMVSFLAEQKMENDGLGFSVEFLYSTKSIEKLEDILFLERLVRVFGTLGKEGSLSLFLTGSQEDVTEEDITKEASKARLSNGKEVSVRKRRIHESDIAAALGPKESRNQAVIYICGVPTMTDDFVEKAKHVEGMVGASVLYEKWW